MSFEALDLGFAGLGSKPPYRTSTIFNWAKLVDGGLVDRDHLSFPRPVEITRDARPGHQSHRNKTRTKNMYTKCSYWGLRFERPYRTFASLNWAPASRRWIGPEISHDHSMVPRRTYGCMLTQILELSKRKKRTKNMYPKGYSWGLRFERPYGTLAGLNWGLLVDGRLVPRSVDITRGFQDQSRLLKGGARMLARNRSFEKENENQHVPQVFLRFERA